MLWSNFNDVESGDWFGSAFDNMRRLHEEMNKLLEETPRGEYPAVQVWANQDLAKVIALLPGADPKAIDLTVLGDVLTIGGERHAEEPGERDHYLRRERSAGRYTRSVELPFLVDSSKVEAEYKSGVLTVTLPRAEDDKPRKITVR